METHVKTTIEIGGKALAGFKELRISQSHNRHHSFEVVIPLEVIEGDKSNNIFKGQDLVGKPIKIEIAHEASSKRSGQLNQFNGLVTGASILRHGVNASDFVLRGFSPTILLDDLPNTRSFSEKSLSQIVDSVLKPYPKNDLKSSVKPTPNPNLAYVTQYEESNYNFLTRMAAFCGQWFYYDGKELRFGSLKDGGEEIEMNMGQDLMEFEMGLKIEPIGFKHISYDYLKNESYDVSAGQAKVSGMNSLGDHALKQSGSVFAQESLSFVRPYSAQRDQLKDFSTNYRNGLAGDLVLAEGTSVNARLKVGSRVKVKSAADQNDEDYGTYTVISVSHFTNMIGSYHNSFEAIPDTVIIPPQLGNFTYPRTDMQPAVVKENDDPDKLNRIKVQFKWQQNPDTTPWLRLVSPHAGKNRGMQFIPEINDEVLVAFENNNPDRPIVIGALHHGKIKHEDRKDKDNFIKTIRTKSDNEIRFCDKDGEEEIIIINKKGLNEIRLSLKEDKIYIKAEKTIEMRAKDITMEAENSITMKTKDMTLSTQKSMKLESQNSFELKNVTSKMESSATAEIKASGPLKVKGAATVDVEGAKTTVKGSGMLELNGGGMAILKGGMVMIN